MKIFNIKYYILFLYPALIFAQVNTYSPYSFFGIGNLESTSFSQQSSMGGLSNSFFENNQLNFSNPSSYSFLELTSVELSGYMNFSNLRQNNLNQDNINTNISALGLGFPISNKTSMAFGLQPYSHVGYYIQDQSLENSIGVVNYNYAGSGGINSAILGLSHIFFDRISIGANLNYHFGTINQINEIEFDTVGFLNYRERISTIVRDLSFDFGLGYKQKVQDYNLQLGFIFSPSVNMNSKRTIFSNTYTLSGTYEYFGDTISDYLAQSGSLKKPNFIGFGISLNKNNKWHLGIDYNYTKWADYTFFGQKYSYMDNLSNIIIGGYWIPKYTDIHNYWNTVQYRFGLCYSNGYLDLNSFNSNSSSSLLLNDYSLSLGLGLPIPKNLSEANIGFQYGIRGTTNNNLIQERYFKIIFSITFNDKWFNKRKID